MNNWIPKSKIVKLAIITAVISVVLYLGGLFVVFRETRAIEDSYHSTESDSYKEDEAGVIKSITETNKEPIDTLQNFFVQKGDEAKFIEQIENMAQSSGIRFETDSISIKTSDSGSFKEDVDVKMAVEGSWKGIMYFISKLEKMPFGVSVDDVDLTTDTSGGWTGPVEFIVFRQK